MVYKILFFVRLYTECLILFLHLASELLIITDIEVDDTIEIKSYWTDVL